MKTKYTLVALALGMSSTVMAQEVDDMYFNSKDRIGLNEANQVFQAKLHHEDDLDAVRTNPVNPSDSYSGRGVNPEYNAQPKNGTSIVQNTPDYFLSGYQPKNINSNLYGGTPNSYANCNCGYNSSYNRMGYGGFGNPYSSFYSPYSNFYSPYGRGFSSGLSTSIGYGFGGYGSGFYNGLNYGMGSMYGNSFYGYNSYGYNNYYGHASNAVIVSGTNMDQSYGRRTSRSSSLNNYVDNNRGDGSIAGSNGRVREAGRVRTDSQPNYYDPTWRSNANNYATRDNSTGMRTNSWGGNTNSRGWNSSNFDTGRTRSSFDSFGSGSRGSFGGGGGSSGGGGGGHSRGRN